MRTSTGKPITLEDHQASRWIAEPAIRLFDCCQETDGSVALVDHECRPGGRRSHGPVLIAAAAAAGLFEEEIASNHYRPDLAVMDRFGGTGQAALRRLRHRPDPRSTSP